MDDEKPEDVRMPVIEKPRSPIEGVMRIRFKMGPGSQFPGEIAYDTAMRTATRRVAAAMRERLGETAQFSLEYETVDGHRVVSAYQYS